MNAGVSTCSRAASAIVPCALALSAILMRSTLEADQAPGAPVVQTGPIRPRASGSSTSPTRIISPRLAAVDEDPDATGRSRSNRSAAAEMARPVRPPSHRTDQRVVVAAADGKIERPSVLTLRRQSDTMSGSMSASAVERHADPATRRTVELRVEPQTVADVHHRANDAGASATWLRKRHSGGCRHAVRVDALRCALPARRDRSRRIAQQPTADRGQARRRPTNQHASPTTRLIAPRRRNALVERASGTHRHSPTPDAARPSHLPRSSGIQARVRRRAGHGRAHPASRPRARPAAPARTGPMWGSLPLPPGR